MAIPTHTKTAISGRMAPLHLFINARRASRSVAHDVYPLYAEFLRNLCYICEGHAISTNAQGTYFRPAVNLPFGRRLWT